MIIAFQLIEFLLLWVLRHRMQSRLTWLCNGSQDAQKMGEWVCFRILYISFRARLNDLLRGLAFCTEDGDVIFYSLKIMSSGNFFIKLVFWKWQKSLNMDSRTVAHKQIASSNGQNWVLMGTIQVNLNGQPDAWSRMRLTHHMITLAFFMTQCPEGVLPHYRLGNTPALKRRSICSKLFSAKLTINTLKWCFQE